LVHLGLVTGDPFKLVCWGLSLPWLVTVGVAA
jgi:hypothetical protein